jgi:hypothetical protein
MTLKDKRPPVGVGTGNAAFGKAAKSSADYTTVRTELSSAKGYLAWRHLPPYAKRLSDRFATGWKADWTGTIFIAAGDHAWDHGGQWAERATITNRAFLVLPPNTDPTVYDWRIVAGHDCVLYDTGGLSDATAEDFAVLMIQTGADLVLVAGEERDTVSYRSRMALGEVA